MANNQIARGNTNLYGYAIGILMMEAYFPRLPGAIGNATTFPFPVLHKMVPGGTGDKVVRTASKIADPEVFRSEIVAPWIKAAQELEREGVRAITSSCGFTAIFQRELAASVNVPVFASSLLMLQILSRMLPPGRRIGVVTADVGNLTSRHFEGVGADQACAVVAGLEDAPHFHHMVRSNRGEVDVAGLRDEVVGAALGLQQDNPDIAMILLECSLLPPFAIDVQRATSLPVFDFTSMITMVHNGIVRRSFDGFV